MTPFRPHLCGEAGTFAGNRSPDMTISMGYCLPPCGAVSSLESALRGCAEGPILRRLAEALTGAKAAQWLGRLCESLVHVRAVAHDAVEGQHFMFG